MYILLYHLHKTILKHVNIKCTKSKSDIHPFKLSFKCMSCIRWHHLVVVVPHPRQMTDTSMGSSEPSEQRAAPRGRSTPLASLAGLHELVLEVVLFNLMCSMSVFLYTSCAVRCCLFQGSAQLGFMQAFLLLA